MTFLRSHGIKVSMNEWMTLMDGLQQGLADCSLMGFYQLSRAVCIKKESQLDLFDQCFAYFFHEIESAFSLNELNESEQIETLFKDLDQWLQDPIHAKHLSPEEKAKLKSLDLEQLKKQFEQRLKEQKERHDGGSKWVGTGGTSPFGHSGYHPSGLRVGGAGLHQSAMQVIAKRRFANLRHDLVLDTRQISLALKKLKRLNSEGSEEKLDIEQTIKKTGMNCGDLSLVFNKEKKNSIKLLLLMDIGGSMTHHSEVSERLFSAAFAARHFKHFEHYYFHNCPYETLYKNMSLDEGIPTKDVLRKLDKSWHLIMVGDAAMSPFELTTPGASVDWYHHNEEAGMVWLDRLKQHFEKSVWLNPNPPDYWNIASNQLVRKIFSMHPLSIAGIEEAIEELKR